MRTASHKPPLIPKRSPTDGGARTRCPMAGSAPHGEPIVKHRSIETATGRYVSAGSRREQALCEEAVLSGEYDDMSDAEWVTMCERIAQEAETAPTPSAAVGQEAPLL